MAVTAGTVVTFDNTLIFDELQNAYSMISPTLCPFQQAVSTGSVASTSPEWPLVELQDADPTNRVAQGESAPGIDSATLGVRLGNYTQISDKVIITSHTSDAVDSAAENIQRLSKQMAVKMKEMKRDKELMFLQNIAASPGSEGVAAVSAGLIAFLRTNTIGGVGGADPELSGGTSGYPDAAAVAGTPYALSEVEFNDMIQSCWEEGGEPGMVLVNANNKRIISETFTGNATRYKDTTNKKAINAIDFYESDFGTLTIVPTRFMLPTDGVGGASYPVLALDPSFISIDYLENVQEKPLAETGHAKSRLLWCEYTLRLEAEAAHGIMRDTDGVMPTP